MVRKNKPYDRNVKGTTGFKKFIAWLTIVAFLGQPTLAVAQAVADPQAPVPNRPSVESAQNGVPVVQITAPSATGVSRNLYQSLNVDPQGLILNNSHVITKTQLAGYIEGNPNLARGSARIILNEVTGTNPSNLRGYLEVAGQRADVIIANPNGIYGDGFGFINTSRAVLTTGTPIFGGAGSLDAFRVTGGQISVQGDGMDASTTDRADIISRAVSVNAGIWGKELNVVTGANQVNYKDLTTQKITGSGDVPEVSLDVAALGGMYANKIKLIGTEAGVGVNVSGNLSAGSGDLVLTQEGKIILTGNSYASENIRIDTKDSVIHLGSTYAQGNTSVNATGVDNSGTLLTGQNMSVSAQNISSAGTLGAGINSDGSIGNSGNLTVSGTSIDHSGATTYAGGSANITATSGNVNHTGAYMQAGGHLTISATGAVTNDAEVSGNAGQIKAGKVTITAGDISNKGSSIQQTGSDITTLAAANSINNTGGQIATNGSTLSIQANSITNNQGEIQQAATGILTVKATGGLQNAGGNIAGNGQVDIQAQNIDNVIGILAAQQQLGITTASLTNSQGLIISDDAINIASQSSINNQHGTIQANKGLAINAQSLNNQDGSVTSLDASDTKITVTQEIQNQSGLIGGNGNVGISARKLINSQNGQLVAQGNLAVTAAQGADNTNGTISTQQDITLNYGSDNLTNIDGTIGAGGTLTIQAAAVDNTSGNIAAKKDINLNGQSLAGTNGKVTAGQDVNITSSGNFIHKAGSQVQANRDVNVNVAGSVTNQGDISAVRNASANGSNVTNSGTMDTTAEMNVTASEKVTNSGQINGSAVTLTAGQTLSNTGSIMGDILTVTADTISNSGNTALLATTGDTNLYARTALQNLDDATIYSMSNINIAGSVNKDTVTGEYTDRVGSVLNQSATIEAGNDIEIYADNITNKKREFVTGQTVISQTKSLQLISSSGGWNYYVGRDESALLPWSIKTYLTGQSVAETSVVKDSPEGRILAGRNMTLNAGVVENDLSSILAAGSLNVSADASVNNITVGRTRSTTTYFKEYRQWTEADEFPVYSHTLEWHRSPTGEPVLELVEVVTYKINTYPKSSEKALPSSTTTVAIPGYTSLLGGGSAVNIQARNVNNIAVIPGNPAVSTVNGLTASGQNGSIATVRQADDNNITLPTNGMFNIHKEPSSKYLVETDPRFANFGKFISSDYMMKKLGLDPEKTMKRLGDGFYEQKLVRDQITELTGRYYLNGYSSAEEQYKALMNNSATYAKQLDLQVGIALTSEQMAQLTSDIVWLVEKEVDGQKVLVPQVYLSRAGNFDLKFDGAIIAADNVNITASGNVNNAGVIQAAEEIDIHAVDIANYGGAIDVGKNIQLTADRDISIIGTQVNAGQDVTINAGRKLDVDSIRQQERIATGGAGWSYLKENINNIVSGINAGNNVTLTSTGDTTLRGAQVSAGNNLTLTAGGNVDITAVKNEEIADIKGNIRRGWKRTRTDDETIIGSTLQAGGEVSVAAVQIPGGSSANDPLQDRGHVTIAGSDIISQTGGVTILADKDVNLQEVTEKHESLVQKHTKKSGFFSSKTTDTRDYSLVNEVKGSTISGEEVEVKSGKDINVRGSNIVGTNDVNLTAQQDINITSAQEIGAEEHYKHTKKSGIFGGGGFGFTIGSQSEKRDATLQMVAQVDSTVASIDGEVNIVSGKDTHITGSNVIGAQGVNVTGQNVTIDAAQNTAKSKETYEFKQSGLSVSLGGGVVSTATNAVSHIQRANEVSDNRLQSLYEYKAVKEVKDLGKQLKGDLKKDLSISVSVGSSKYKSETVTIETSAQGSTLTSDKDINIIATGSGAQANDGSVNIIGSDVTGQNITITAAKDVNLQSADNTSQSKTTSSGSSSGVGMSFGAQTGAFIQGNKSSGNANETGTNHTETQVTVQDTLTMNSGNDTNIIGAQAKGETVIMDVGGNLNLASQQDTESYTERNTSTSASIGFSGNMPSIGSFGQGKTDSDYQSVTDQSGIYVGTGGFDIEVGGNTDLKGAVISSDATPDKNKISTDTLTYSDIENKAEYSASSVGVSVNTDKNADYNEHGITPNIGMPANGDADSTTKSAISQGTIEVRSGNTNLSNLSRDTANSLNALGKIFDKKTVEEQQELAKVFGEVAFEAVGDLALKNGWKEGSPEKIALHALVGGIMAQMGEGSFTSGAVGAGINEVVQKELAEKFKDNPDLHQWASFIIGSAAAKIVGGDAQTGGSTAASGTKNNWLNHRQQVELAEKLSKATSDEERLKILEEYQALSQINILSGVDPDTGLPVPRDPVTGQAYEAIEPELLKVLDDLNLPGTFGTVNYNVDNSGLNNNLAMARNQLYYGNETLELGKNVGESLVDAAAGKHIIDQLRTSFTIGKVSAPSIGPATTLEIAVDTTPGSTIALKNVSKVLGGVVALGQTTYDVYVDYQTFGGFNEKFAMAAGADIGTTVVLALGGGAAVSLGAPVIAVSIVGGGVAYLVNKEVIKPWKEGLKQ